MENTTGGKVLPLRYMRDIQQLAQRHGLRSHIDGARIFNAAVALAQESGSDPHVQARELCRGYDSISVCLSKGLGAPVGSVLVGSSAFIAEARRIRKMVGGGMRQAGLLAAAGIHALQHHVHRLADDHALAAALARGLAEVTATHPALAQRVTVHAAHTNMVFIDIDATLADDFMAHLNAHGVRVTGGVYRSDEGMVRRIRWVTHLDVGPADVERALDAVARF
jgi:threonine aldolase